MPARPFALILLPFAFLPAFAADPATITGRVFDTYHRPVPAAEVVTIAPRRVNGERQLVPGARATVNSAGMYRLTLPPGRYILAVTPPPKPLDFAAVFPAYLGDIADINQAPSVEVRPGELKPFVDFLLLDVESHRLTGQVTGIPASNFSVAVSLHAETGYTEPLRTLLTDPDGRFQIDHVPGGSYRLQAAGPVTRLDGLQPVLGNSPRYGSAQIRLLRPEITGIAIHLRAAAR